MAMRGAEATRTKIEEAALRLFVEQGVAETGIREIAAAAGVSEGAMYRHYPSKEALVWGLFSLGLARFARDLDARQAQARGTRAKCAAMVRAFAELFDETPVLFRFILLVQHRQIDKLAPDAPNPVEVVRRVIADGMAAGEVPQGDADLATAMVMGIILQTATFKLYGRIKPSLTELAPTLAASCWKVLGTAKER
jgi:AcrR family transcriptional regulator